MDKRRKQSQIRRDRLIVSIILFKFRQMATDNLSFNFVPFLAQFLGDEETVKKAIESVAAQGKAK